MVVLIQMAPILEQMEWRISAQVRVDIELPLYSIICVLGSKTTDNGEQGSKT